MKEEDRQNLLPPGEPNRSLRMSIYEGAAYMFMVGVSASAIRTFFATALGATDADFSAMTAMSTIGTLGAVAGAKMIGHVGSRKKVIMATVWCRLIWLAVAVLPILTLPPRAGLLVLMAAVLITAFTETILGNTWMSWMVDLVPAARRSRYFGIRNAIHGAVAIVAAWVIGHAFDYLRAPDRLGELKVFMPLYLFAGISGLITAFFMNRQWEPPLDGEKPMPLAMVLRLPFAHTSFRRLIAFYLMWTVVTAIAMPFWQPHMIKNLQMDGATIAIYTILAALVSLCTQPLWGRIIDRAGSKPVLVISMAGIAFLPLLWLFARPDFLWCIWIDAVLTGLLWPGFNLATFNIHLQTAPKENRQAYLAAITVVVGVVGFLTNLLGGSIVTACDGFHATLLGFPLVNYHVIFVLSAVGRLAILPLVRTLHEERSYPAAAVIVLAGQKVSAILSEGMQYGVERIKRLAKP